MKCMNRSLVKIRCLPALAVLLLVWAAAPAAGTETQPEDRDAARARLRLVEDLAPVAAMVSAGLLSLERNRGGSYDNALDLRFDLGAAGALRLYRQHALRKTMYQGAALTRSASGGRSVLWELATFQTTPLLEGSLAFKRSVFSPRKRTTLALASLPRIGAGLPIERESRYLLMWSRDTAGRDHAFLESNSLRGRWHWRRKAALAFVGESPVVDSLSALRQDFQIHLEMPLTRQVRPYLVYNHILDAGQLGGLVTNAQYLDTPDWGEALTMNRSAGAGFTVALPGGAALIYGLETDRHFQTVRDTVSFSRSLGRGIELTAAYTHDRGEGMFTEPWQEHRTRVQLMKRRDPGLSWGLFMEWRPDETVAGLALMRGAGPDDPLPFLPESRFREPYADPAAHWDFNTGSITCGSFASYEDAAATLVTPELVSQFSKCLSFGDYDSAGPLHSPQEIFAGAQATCRSSSWLQASVLTRNGYEAYVIAFQSSQSVMGAETDTRFSINHAVTAYRDPATGTWNLIDYERIIRTGAPTIQQAMEIYSPNYLFMRVEEPDKLLPIGIYDSRTMQTIKEWVEAGP